MVEKSHTCINVGISLSVKLCDNINIGFTGFSRDFTSSDIIHL